MALWNKILARWNALGIRENQPVWEQFLVRKINFILIIGFINVGLAFLLFPLFGVNDFQVLLGFSVIMAPVVLFANANWNYRLGIYGFYLLGLVQVITLAVKMGQESYFLFFVFPITMSIVQLLGRRETMHHMFILMALFLSGIFFIAYCYYYGLYRLDLDLHVYSRLKMFNITVSAFTAMSFIVKITVENVRQEEIIRKTLKEKEVLMAEVFHRVKNNMNIVNSLLNLKRQSSQSQEVQQALDECRNRIYSMSLVHQKMFDQKDISLLNFREYAEELTESIKQSVGFMDSERVSVEAEDLELHNNQAIPCGLILNELMTNSVKHARMDRKALEIRVRIYRKDKQIHLEYADNGPGIDESKLVREGAMGLDLIKGLSAQLGGEYRIYSAEGMRFEICF